MWTTKVYQEICNSMRGVAPASPGAVNVIKSMKAYVKHVALVAPAAPVGMETPAVLWRGVHEQDPPAVGATVSANGGCFSAFTHDLDVAEHFAHGGGGSMFALEGFLYRLQVDRIARGTPWIWTKWGKSHAKNAIATDAGESEVVLPPGYFKVLRRSVQPDAMGIPLTVVDIAFFAHPAYVRKGALPAVGDGKAVTRTIRGDRLELNHPEVVENARARRARTK